MEDWVLVKERAHRENDWDHMVEADVVERPVERVTRKEVVEAIKKRKRGIAAGLSEMIMASGKIGEDVMMQICQRVLDGNGIPDEWKTSVVVPIFKGKKM